MEQKEQEFKFVGDGPHVFEISVVVEDIEKSIEQVQSLFGLTPYKKMESPIPNCYLRGKKVKGAAMKLAYYRAGPIRFEILQPMGDSIYTEFLRKKGTAVQHVGCRVSDLDSELAELEKRGIGAIAGMEAPQADLKIAYLDSEDIVGFHIELVQSPGLPGED
jgi:methylmalonyl-CoA/ethylmalonyl-CoA epimerase